MADDLSGLPAVTERSEMAADLPRTPPGAVPWELARLLEARNEARANSAWDDFLNSYGHLLLRTAKFTQRGHDASMDAYAYVLGRLRQDGFARLRAFTGGDRDNLSRWLVVISRRLCLDFRRERYGRTRASTPEIERDARRRLVDGIWDSREPSDLAGPTSANPEMQLRRGDLTQAVEAAVSELEPRDQLLLALRFENGLSARRIAEIMHWPTPFHVYRRLNKILQVLRARLEDRGIEDANP